MEAKDSVTLDEKCVAAMKPDALSPAETEAKTEGIGVTGVRTIPWTSLSG